MVLPFHPLGMVFFFFLIGVVCGFVGEREREREREREKQIRVWFDFLAHPQTR